ncbi:MAG: HesA/MoeB/ThiF family protein [Alysiella sp.]|uniref:HesA/MoeB/ThiF family protein n=1 Tax=Alysiella sp. TaxID=1872483 RepID=UPI0026DC675E|nr:HesA/MoeB/ThiF family protein [Alysiella sp.]MDO4434692.1 HesA/MoeB/ThiF family protein [Alysiella sp.]
MNDRQLLHYSRHILLDEIGIENQSKLLSSCILVVGCGGLGVAALPYLASAGVGKLLIADADCVDETNLQRQTIYTPNDIGCLKADCTAHYLRTRYPDCQITALNQYLDATQLAKWVAQADVILDCSDNFATRQAINAACVAAKKPLVLGAAVRFEGQVAVFRADLGQNQACYRCLFDTDNATEQACATFGVFAPLVGTIGTFQAAEALKIIMGLPVSISVLRCYSALTGNWQTFHFHNNPQCHVCGTETTN